MEELDVARTRHHDDGVLLVQLRRSVGTVVWLVVIGQNILTNFFCHGRVELYAPSTRVKARQAVFAKQPLLVASILLARVRPMLIADLAPRHTGILNEIVVYFLNAVIGKHLLVEALAQKPNDLGVAFRLPLDLESRDRRHGKRTGAFRNHAQFFNAHGNRQGDIGKHLNSRGHPPIRHSNEFEFLKHGVNAV